jgi:hypothetical protein
MQLDKQIYDEINEYCKLNGLKTRDFIHNLLKEAFMKEKYGDSPFAFNKNSEPPVVSNDSIKKNDDMEELIQKTMENVIKQELEPSLPSQVLKDYIAPIVPESQDAFEVPEKTKPKKKRTLK